MLKIVKFSLIIILMLSTASSFTLAQTDKSDRLLAIDVNEAEDEEYDAAFGLAKQIGMQTLSLSLDWEALEPAPGQYDPTWLEIANIYYPAYHTPLNLVIRPIHTGTLRVPTNLQHTDFDDPVMAERFMRLLDFIFQTTPDLKIHSLVIGSELDGYLGSDAGRWQAYTEFARVVSDYARAQRPGLRIAFETMYQGISDDAILPYIQMLNQLSDVIGISYYPLGDNFQVQPLSTVAKDFKFIVEAFPGQTIYFYQLGYPSSELNGSSQAAQANFIREVFSVWDQHADQIGMIQFTWLTEQSSDSVAYFEDYYGYSSQTFAAFLESLGLRHRDGTPKPAIEALKAEAAARGW